MGEDMIEITLALCATVLFAGATIAVAYKCSTRNNSRYALAVAVCLQHELLLAHVIVLLEAAAKREEERGNDKAVVELRTAVNTARTAIGMAERLEHGCS